MKPPTPTERHEALDVALMCLHHICHGALVAGDPGETLEIMQRGLDVMWEQIEKANGKRLEVFNVGLN